jgi:dTDP-4-dehydrorhamnose reductase
VRVLVAGCKGQLGTELARTAPQGATLVGMDLPELDVTDPSSVFRAIEAARPDVIINASAYTAVDKAEQERAKAFAVNAEGVGHLAAGAANHGARFLHVSTDYVFDGRSGVAYKPSDPTSPLGAYGETKLAGEQKALEATGGKAVVVRTAWLYAAHGGNFVKTMLRLMAERPEVRVVGDQLGSPTWARELALALWTVIERPEISGVLHWTGAGVASWYDFAVAIQEEALALGLLQKAVPIVPIRTEEYPTPARRPPCGVLDKSETWARLGRRARHWRAELRDMLEELKESHG